MAKQSRKRKPSEALRKPTGERTRKTRQNAFPGGSKLTKKEIERVVPPARA